MFISSYNRITGLSGSGFDIEGTVEKIMQAKRKNYDRLFQKKQTTTWKKEAYQEINLALTKFRESAFNMQLSGNILAKKASSTNESKVSASAVSSATNGTNKIWVKSLAEGATKTSTGSVIATGHASNESLASLFGVSGDIKFEINGEEVTVNSNDNINGLVTAINYKSSITNVKASYDSTSNRFFLTTTKTGEDQKIELTDTADSFLNTCLKLNTADVVTGKSAEVYLNDMDRSGEGLKYSSNSFTINGVNYNLKNITGMGDNDYVAVNVESDVDAIFDKIKNFMDDYNSLLDTLYGKLHEEKLYKQFPPLTDQQKEQMKEEDIKKWEEKSKTGLLTNDMYLNNGFNALREAMIQPVAGLANSSQLTAIGIETGFYYEYGKLKFSDSSGDKLKEALRKDPDSVIRLFNQAGTVDTATNTDSRGIAVRLTKAIDNTLGDLQKLAGGKSSGALDRNTTLGEQIYELGNRVSAEEARLKKIEERYWAQFTKMEQALSKMNTQSSWLSQQLGG